VQEFKNGAASVALFFVLTDRIVLGGQFQVDVEINKIRDVN